MKDPARDVRLLDLARRFLDGEAIVGEGGVEKSVIRESLKRLEPFLPRRAGRGAATL